jgi:hypothetical protein
MPAYNAARFLAQAVDSILTQTHRDLELIVVDDGSTDDSYRILAARAAADSRVRVLRHEKNRGIIAARNTAAEAVQAELTAVMDSDDVARPHRLATQIAYLTDHPDVAALGAAIQFIDAANRPGAIKSYPTNPGACAFAVNFFNPMCHSAVMVRTRWVREVGAYSEDYSGAEDYGLLAAIGRVAPLANVPDVLLNYRISGVNNTTTKWALQDAQGTRIVQMNVEQVTSLRITPEEAHGLRGLARDEYPATPASIERLAEIVTALVPPYVDRISRTGEDRAAIRNDAATRLLQLAALAATKAPRLAARLTARALRLSPVAGVRFSAKAGKRLLGR